MNKKGFHLMPETYAAVALAILISVVLISFYDLRTGRFSAFFRELIGDSNVDSAVALCNNLVSRQAIYEYCCAKKEVRYEEEGEIKEEQMTCQELSEMSFGSRIEKISCRKVC